MKRNILQKIIKKRYEDFLRKQRLLRDMVLKDYILLPGLDITKESYMEPPHNHQDRYCDKGFIILKTSINLSLWEDQTLGDEELFVGNLTSQG